MASKSIDALMAAMSEDSRNLLQRGQHLADCQVVTSDQHVFNLHKMILTQESLVLGNMFADLEQDCGSVTVSENGASFAMLVDAMYAPDRKGPLTEDCIDELSDLQRRYNMMRLNESCSLIIGNIRLTVDNLPRWHVLACEFGYTHAIEHCRTYIASGHFDAINRQHPNCLDTVVPNEAIRILKERLAKECEKNVVRHKSSLITPEQVLSASWRVAPACNEHKIACSVTTSPSLA